jgi:hypothetical protein
LRRNIRNLGVAHALFALCLLGFGAYDFDMIVIARRAPRFSGFAFCFLHLILLETIIRAEYRASFECSFFRVFRSFGVLKRVMAVRRATAAKMSGFIFCVLSFFRYEFELFPLRLITI